MSHKKCASFVICIFLFLVPLCGQIVINNYEEAVNIALKNSKAYTYEGMGALLNMRAAKLNFSDFLPSFGISYSDNTSISNNSLDNLNKSFSLTVSQLLFDGGQRFHNYQIGNLSRLYEYNQYEQERRLFSAEILKQYYSILKKKEELKIKNELLTTATTQLVIIKKESELGITLETEYLDYLINYLETENNRDICDRELKKMIDAFKVSLGCDRNVEIIFYEAYSNYNEYEPLSDYIDFIYKKALENSIDLKNQNLSIMSIQKQIRYKNQWFIPSVELEGSLSFSGKTYPLTEPNYSVKLSLSFDRIPFLPTSYKKNVGGKKQVSSIGDSVSATLKPNTLYSIENKQNKLSLLQSELQLSNISNEIYENVINTVYTHDDYVHKIDMHQRKIDLLQKKIDVSEIELKNGALKRTDFLQSLINLSSAKIELLEEKVNTGILENSIEIMLQIPFGELKNVCREEQIY